VCVSMCTRVVSGCRVVCVRVWVEGVCVCVCKGERLQSVCSGVRGVCMCVCVWCVRVFDEFCLYVSDANPRWNKDPTKKFQTNHDFETPDFLKIAE